MKILTLTCVSAMALVLFGGCDGSSDNAEPTAENFEVLLISSVHYLTKKISLEDARTIKPLQIITNESELQTLLDTLVLGEFRQKVDFTKDIVIVVKRFLNAPTYINSLQLHNDGNQTIEIQSTSAEISTDEEPQASICLGLVISAYNKPIYLTKRTVLIDKETADIRHTISSFQTSITPSVSNMAYVTTRATRHHLMPHCITDIAHLETYAATHDLNISQLRFNDEPYVEGNIMLSGYYVATDNNASFDRPVLNEIQDGIELQIIDENNISEWVPNYHYSFDIKGVRNDCEETYPNVKEVLFYKFNPANSPGKIWYHTAQQNIIEKSCANLRTADLEELGKWMSKRTWQAE